MPAKFLTLSPDLHELADQFSEFLRADGYKVAVEPIDVSYPARPTLLGSRRSGRYFVEVNNVCRGSVLADWSRYAKTRSQETFVALVLPHGTNVAGRDLAMLREEGIGYFMMDATGVREILGARDLGVTMSLPDLKSLPKQVQGRLRAVYRKFDGGEFVDGFKDACQCVEEQARERLKVGVTSTRIAFVRAGRSRVVLPSQIDRLTLGQLAGAYSEIVAPNSDDVLVGRAIAAINDDRIAAVHRTNDARARARLRKNVARHMWTITGALKVLA